MIGGMDGARLDRYITGNYGEDELIGDAEASEWDIELERFQRAAEAEEQRGIFLTWSPERRAAQAIRMRRAYAPKEVRDRISAAMLAYHARKRQQQAATVSLPEGLAEWYVTITEDTVYHVIATSAREAEDIVFDVVRATDGVTPYAVVGGDIQTVVVEPWTSDGYPDREERRKLTSWPDLLELHREYVEETEWAGGDG